MKKLYGEGTGSVAVGQAVMLQLVLTVALICGVSGQQASISVSGKGPGSCLIKSTKNWVVTKEVSSVTDDSVDFVIETSNSGTETTPTLKFGGSLIIENGAAGAATIGNIVFNLLRKATTGNTWNTVCTNIANTQSGDAATTANVVKVAVQATAACAVPPDTPFAQGGLQTYSATSGVCKLSENTGGRPCSGPIEFKTADGNTIFSIEPEFVIGAGTTVELIYATSFVNPQAVAGGSGFKLEIIVTFANAGNRGGGGASSSVPLDVTGNDLIDNLPNNADYPEKYVRSVPVRIDLTLPPVYECNKCVQLKDSPVDDVQESGDLTYNTPTTDIANTGNEQLCANAGNGGAVERHMAVTGVAGAGTISNCAHLQGVSTDITWITGYDALSQPIIQSVPCCEGVDVSDCADHTFTPEVDPENPGPNPRPQACTYTQGGWFAPPNGNNVAQLLSDAFAAVFPTGVTIGTAALNSATWTSAAAIEAMSPGGLGDVLTADLLNPTSTSAGAFGAHILAATLNVAFSDYAFSLSETDASYDQTIWGIVYDHPVENLGSFVYCPSNTDAPLYGLTVQAILDIANNKVAGGADSRTASTIDAVVNALNEEFDNCVTPGDETRVFFQVNSCADLLPPV